MALVKCKECGEQVSTQAKTCPKCGARVPKKTSLITWVVLIFIIYVVYQANQGPSTKGSYSGSKKQTSSSVSTQDTEIITDYVPPKPRWTTSTFKDKMTGKLKAYAHSPSVMPSKRMSFPYNDVRAWLGVGCDGKNEWAYIGFNSAPNLADTETEDGYNLIRTRIKWNDQLENVSLTQNWSAEFIHFRHDGPAISKIAGSNTTLLELQWHGEQPTYFEFSLDGSSKAISEIRAKCSKL